MMRFSLAETMCEPTQYVPLAKAAEEAGFHAYTIPDSLAYPEVSDSKYPYTPDGNRNFLENKPFIEPFSLIPALGMVTQHLRYHTFVLKLPMRHPVLAAKQAASTAVMTNNRLSLGVGLSPWPEDFRITGVPWEGRGKRMDEMIDIMRGLWTGEFFAYQGKHFQIESIKMCPAPTKPVPILIGGHSEAALRRAARVGDGWMHAGGDGTVLLDLLKQLDGYRKEYGRENAPFEIHVISMDAYSLDGLKKLEELGVTDVIVGFRKAYESDSTPLEKKLTAIRRYGDSIIARAKAA
jgi:probable F420-dependent oxidoreductase